MAEIQSMYKCVFLFALIASHAILSTEGRKIKSTNKKEATSTEGNKEILPPISYGESASNYKDDFRPTTPGNSPGVGHSNVQEREDVESKLVADQHSITVFKDDFRPTSPGHSPSIGHSFVQEKGEVDSKVVANQQSVTGFNDNFRPTTPIQSPSVGHPFSQDDEDVESKALANQHSTTESEDNFHPTAGHGPGVGHALQNMSAEPKA